MRIKSSNGNATTNVIKPKRAARVITLTKPMGYAAMPKLVEGKQGKRVQGGHAPVAYRSRCADWGSANKKARA